MDLWSGVSLHGRRTENRIDDAETSRRGVGARCVSSPDVFGAFGLVRREGALPASPPSPLAADSSGLRICNVPLASPQNLGHGCIKCRIGRPLCVGRVKGPERAGMQRAFCVFVCLRATRGGTATVSCILDSVAYRACLCKKNNAVRWRPGRRFRACDVWNGNPSAVFRI